MLSTSVPIDVGALLEEQLDDLDVPLTRSPVQRRVSLYIRHFDVSTLLEE